MNTGTGAPDDFDHRLRAAAPRLMVTPALLAINVVAFAAVTLLGTHVLGGRPEEYLRFGANFAPLTTDGAWWRLVTHAFVHIGVLHLAIALWALWDSGRLAERLLHGPLWFALLYLFAAAAGGCASLLWNQHTISAGASGAVFGIYGALLAYLTAYRGAIPAGTMSRLRVSAGVFVTYALFYGFAGAGITNVGHLGGLAGGYAMGLVAARPLSGPARGAGSARRMLLAALLAAVALPVAALLIPDAARVYRQALALEKASAAFNAEESSLNAAIREIVTRMRDGRLGDDIALRELRTTLLPAWDAAVARLADAQPDAGAPLRRDYDLLMEYALAQRDMIRAVADYLDSGDPAQQNAVAALRARAQDALARYRQRQKQ